MTSPDSPAAAAPTPTGPTPTAPASTAPSAAAPSAAEQQQRDLVASVHDLDVDPPAPERAGPPAADQRGDLRDSAGDGV